LFYLANDKRKRFGWKYIWTNNGRIHLRQTNDSKVITIRHEKDFEQIKNSTADSGNLYGLYAFADSLENSLMKYLYPPFGMVSGLHIVLTFAWCVIIHLIIHLTNNHGSLQKV